MSMFLDTAKIKVKAGNGGVVKNTSLTVDLGAVMAVKVVQSSLKLTKGFVP